MHASACSEPASHVYVGRFFVEARRCLGTASSLEVVDGPDPGSCPPLCLVQKGHDASRAVYVSTMCGPYPLDFETTGADPACRAALDALARGDTCLSDGGTAHPPADAAAE
jgi:hypothetical protein